MKGINRMELTLEIVAFILISGLGSIAIRCYRDLAKKINSNKNYIVLGWGLICIVWLVFQIYEWIK